MNNKVHKAALVTGGTRGIGFGIARALAHQGYDLAINGVRNETEAEECLAELRTTDVAVVYCQGNIASREGREHIVATAFKAFPSIHVLVNNAGMAPRVRKDILELTEADYDELMEVNLKGAFFLTQEVARRMSLQKRRDNDYQPSIVNISSVSAEFASVNRAAYCISKAGLAMMTKLFAVALADANIPVYEVRPGIIATDMTSGVKEKYDRLIKDGLALEKRWGTPDDIGKAVAALVRGDIPYATGQVIQADGGLHVSRL